MGITVITIVLLIVGLLTGLLAPAVVKSRRPYRVGGDVVVSVLIMVVVGLVEWQWVLPALNFTGWIAIAATIGDPFFGALIVLWLMRKIRPAAPPESD